MWRALQSTRSAALQLVARALSTQRAAPGAALIASRIQHAITPAVAASLQRDGYAVVDNLFQKGVTQAFREEIVRLHQQGRMHLNHTHLVDASNRTQLVRKRSIHEAELTLDASTQQLAPLCHLINQDATLATMLNVLLPHLRLDSQKIKLQLNAGQGGCFPLHLDTMLDLDGRLITSIFYLNPTWQPSHGGHFRLVPWPLPPVDVAPLDNRLVLFSSARMLHRVLPSSAPAGAERCCFTIWLSREQGRAAAGRRGPPPSLAQLQPKGGLGDEEGTLRFLMHPHVRPHAMKLALADEWERSLAESHDPGPELDSLLAKHRVEVALIRRALSKFVPMIERLQGDAELSHRAHACVSYF